MYPPRQLARIIRPLLHHTPLLILVIDPTKLICHDGQSLPAVIFLIVTVLPTHVEVVWARDVADRYPLAIVKETRFHVVVARNGLDGFAVLVEEVVEEWPCLYVLGAVIVFGDAPLVHAELEFAAFA